MSGVILAAISIVYTMLLSRVVRDLKRRVKDLEARQDAPAQKEQP